MGRLTGVTRVSLAIVALAAVAFLTVPGLRGGHDVPLLAAAGLFFGAPHGAVDHLLPQTDGWPLRGRALIGVISLYVAVVGIVLALTLVAPVVGIAAVIVFSVVHLGSADAALARERRGQAPRYGPVAVLAYGGPLGFVSIARWPGHVRDIFAVISPRLAGDLRIPALVATGVTGVAVVLFVARALRRREWTDAAEVLTLTGFVLVVPPFAAFGIYFAAWHSLRQYVRLYADARGATGRDPIPLSARKLFATMAMAGAATAAFAVAVVVVLRTDAHFTQRYHLGDWLTVLLAAVVAPHMITILRYDRWKAVHAPAKEAALRGHGTPGTAVKV